MYTEKLKMKIKKTFLYSNPTSVRGTRINNCTPVCLNHRCLPRLLPPCPNPLCDLVSRTSRNFPQRLALRGAQKNLHVGSTSVHEPQMAQHQPQLRHKQTLFGCGC